jgi:hypothetical protein
VTAICSWTGAGAGAILGCFFNVVGNDEVRECDAGVAPGTGGGAWRGAAGTLWGSWPGWGW